MNPYVGPRRFEEQDARFFYGREQESRDLLAFVISEPLVLFYAQSGAGKSSLINTSLVPGLRQDNFEVLPVGRVGGNLPAGISEVRNIYTFNLLSNLNPEENPNRFTRTLLTDYLDQTSQGNGHRPSRVLIIDQFEEVVTNHPGRWRDREDFFWQLQSAIHNDPNLWVVLSMREDHFAAVESFAEILPGGLRARFRMERLRLAAAKTAIEKPAAAAGKPFDPGVARELVKNLSLIRETDSENGRQRYGEYIEPVQLQVVCFQLWENLKDQPITRITKGHVEALGNVDRALGAFYDLAVREIVAQGDISEIMLRSWFEKKLITEAHTRGTVYQGPEETEGLANSAVHQLADKYLLRSDRRAGAVWYELVHDRFVDPILQANAGWLEQKGLLVQAAIAWEQSGRSPSKLYLGEQLKDTLANVDWRSTEPLIIEFLKECGRANQERAEREAIRQRELEQAKKLAAEEQKRAEAEGRSARRLRGLAVGLVILFFIAIFSFFSARENAQNANAAANEAATAESIALLAESSAIESASEAGTARAIALEEAESAKESELRALNAQATSDAITKQLTSQIATSEALGNTVDMQVQILAQTAEAYSEKIILDVPYMSQFAEFGPSTSTGGPTALAMVLNSRLNNQNKITTSFLYSEYLSGNHSTYIMTDGSPLPIRRTDQPIDFPVLQGIADLNQNIDLIHTSSWQTSPSPLEELKDRLRENKPVIVLVNHDNLRSAGSTYQGGNKHNYLVVVGYDYDHIYVHDPANPNSIGCYFALTNEQFINAWGASAGVNSPYQSTGLVPENISVPQLTEIPRRCP